VVEMELTTFDSVVLASRLISLGYARLFNDSSLAAPREWKTAKKSKGQVCGPDLGINLKAPETE